MRPLGEISGLPCWVGAIDAVCNYLVTTDFVKLKLPAGLKPPVVIMLRRVSSLLSRGDWLAYVCVLKKLLRDVDSPSLGVPMFIATFLTLGVRIEGIFMEPGAPKMDAVHALVVFS